VSANEEILAASMQQSRRTIRALEAMQREVTGLLERERKQFERLHFAYKKVRSDAAYLAAIEKMLHEREESDKWVFSKCV
jgi:hypothetical protein